MLQNKAYKIAIIARKWPVANIINAFGNALFFSSIRAADIARPPSRMPFDCPKRVDLGICGNFPLKCQPLPVQFSKFDAFSNYILKLSHS